MRRVPFDVGPASRSWPLADPACSYVGRCEVPLCRGSSAGVLPTMTGGEDIVGNFGTTEIILIAAVLLLLFGATQIPKIARALGHTKRAFIDGIHGSSEEETTGYVPSAERKKS